MIVDTQDKQVVAHLYRGEMNRMTVYRQRLDTTTNWAITLESAILVIYINKNINFYFIFFPLTILVFFSFLEARRYRYFFTSAKRVQYLEIEYFGKQIFQKRCGDQFYLIIDNIMDVKFLITLKQAWAIRFYRNYMWLCYISLLIMIYKYLTIDLDKMPHLYFSITLFLLFVMLHVILHFHQNINFIDL